MSTQPDASIPNHLAIIMDGNGRWAKAQGRQRFYGHIKGTRVAKKIIEDCVRLDVKHLTLYAFSFENWDRPELEVSFLMRLLLRYIKKEKLNLHKNKIRFRCIGQLDKLGAKIRTEIESTEALTKDNDGMVLTFALSYGGRQEITGAVKAIASLVEEKSLSPDQIDENLISNILQTSPYPDPDFLIRTSGEWRLSNFLPWQLVYTELYFADDLWPDFTTESLEKAFENFGRRERRFGKVSPLPGGILKNLISGPTTNH